MRSTFPLLLGTWAVALLTACGGNKSPPDDGAAAAANTTQTSGAQEPVTTPSTVATPPNELVIKEVKAGAGPAIAKGAEAVVQYTGWLYDPAAPDHKGVKFDSSRDRNEPFQFSLGAGQVIQGWDKGVEGLQVGGQRQLIIPPDMGYGVRGAGGVIPPNATLVFDVELVGIK